MEKPNFEGFIDPSLPRVIFDAARRKEMRENGLTEEEINQKEALANLIGVEDAVDKEMMSQGVKKDEAGVLEATSAEEAADIIRQLDERNKDQAA